MSMEGVLATALRAHAGVSGIVGTRIYPVALPPTPTYPSVVYQLVSRAQDTDHPLGPYGPTAARSRFQFDCWASGQTNSSFSNAVNLAAQVKAALIGLMATAQVDVVIENTMDFNEPETTAVRRMIEAVITHEEGI